MKPKVVRTVVNLIEEHHFEILKVKYPDGSIRQVYLPCDDDSQSRVYDEVVPGNHIIASLLSYLLFNRYQMCSTQKVMNVLEVIKAVSYFNEFINIR